MTQPVPRELPLVFQGDAYTIDVEVFKENHVRLLAITKFPMNRNYGERHKFFDLPDELRQRILQQIQRVYRGHMLHLK